MIGGVIVGKLAAAATPYLIGAGVLAAITGAIWGYGHMRYSTGFAKAESQCEAAALRSQLETMMVDRDAARLAETDAQARVARVQADARAELEGVAEYVEELKRRPSAACALTDADLRGMRIDAGPDPAEP